MKGRKCPVCDSINKESKLNCGVCGNNLKNVFVKRYHAETVEKKVRNVSQPSLQETSSYQTAKSFSQFLEFIGWMMVLASVALAAYTVGELNSAMGIGLALALGLFTAGLLVVAGAQIQRAVVDTADHTKDAADHIKKILDEMQNK